MADFPSPGNPCGSWDFEPGAEGTVARQAASAAAFPGWPKYDAQHWRLDAGVVAVRDVILALQADALFTHEGEGEGGGAPAPLSWADITAKCYFTTSNFVREIVTTRAVEGRVSVPEGWVWGGL